MPLDGVQGLMDQPDGDRAFTDRRRHAFDRATPYVTDSEDARPARLEHASVAVPGRSGEHEPFLVQRYLPVEPKRCAASTRSTGTVPTSRRPAARQLQGGGSRPLSWRCPRRVRIPHNSAVVVALVGWSVVMWIAERVGKRDRPESSLNLKDAVIIGLVQCFALIPGVSRSGATISAGLLRDLDRVAATRLAFFLAIPALVAAGAYEAIKEASVISAGIGWLPTLQRGSALSSATPQSPGCCDSWPSTASRCSSGIAWHWRRSSRCCSAQGC